MVGYAAESESELSCRDATGMTLITETVMEKQRKLVLREDVDALIDQMAGITLTHLSGMAARCGSRDMQVASTRSWIRSGAR